MSKPIHQTVVTFELTAIPEGTRLDFTHADLPESTEEEFTQGWIDNYWEPMKIFLEKAEVGHDPV